MSLFAIAMIYLRSHLSMSILHIVLMALGVGMMSALILLGHQLQERLYKDSTGIDAVVGAKGSPLQLILSTVQHMDIPTGNIALSDARRIQQHPKVKQAIPLSLGDSFQRFRIVGTEQAYLTLYDAELAEGNIWAKPMQAVIGAQVAKESGLQIGDKLVGSHGLVESGDAHADHPYHVVGVLQPTGRVIDRLVLTSLESVWDIHGDHDHHDHQKESHDHVHHDHHDHDTHDHGHKTHDDHAHHNHAHRTHEHHNEHEHTEAFDNKEITALLIQYRTRTAALTFPREINKNTAMQAASPALEMARLVDLIGIGSNTLMTIGGVLVGVSLLGVLIALFNAVRERRYDLALFRTFGAARHTIVSLVVIEGMTIAVIGSTLGVALGYGGLLTLGRFTEKGMELGLGELVLLPQLLWLWGIVLLLSFIACLIPAWQVYRLNIREMLIHGAS